MLNKKQIEKVIELLKQNISITEISKKTGISRTKITEIAKDHKKTKTNFNENKFENDIESDSEIIKLKKELREVELKKKIREQKQPFEAEKKLKEFEKRIVTLEKDPNCYYNWERINKIEEELGIE